MFKDQSIKSVKNQMLYNMVHGLRDFGVYAITFMVSFVIKKDLTSISFDGKLLWDLLYDCYKQ